MHIQCSGHFEVSLKGYHALPYNVTMKLESAKTVGRKRVGKCKIIPLTCVQKTDCYRIASRWEKHQPTESTVTIRLYNLNSVVLEQLLVITSRKSQTCWTPHEKKNILKIVFFFFFFLLFRPANVINFVLCV
jgi:hypothetical protein